MERSPGMARRKNTAEAFEILLRIAEEDKAKKGGGAAAGGGTGARGGREGVAGAGMVRPAPPVGRPSPLPAPIPARVERPALPPVPASFSRAEPLLARQPLL